MADYQGGADISVSGILKNLPSSVEKCYELFYRYFFGTLVKHNMLQETAVVFALIFCVVGAALACRLVRLIRRKDWENTFYGTAALLVLPMMCTVFMVATSQALFYIPMSGGLALFLPVCFWLLDSSREGKTACVPEQGNKARWLVLVLAFLVVYGNVYMMAVDQEAMRQGRDSLRVMSDQIVNDLTEEGCFDEGNHWSVMIAGRPSSNPTFKKGDLYPSANRYAQMGCFWLSPECARLSWRGVFEKITPVEITLCEDEDYQKLRQTELVAEMPVYPQEGYIQQVGDIVIVKVSEDYLIDE